MFFYEELNDDKSPKEMVNAMGMTENDWCCYSVIILCSFIGNAKDKLNLWPLIPMI